MIVPSIYHSLERINIEPDHISFLSTHLHIQQMEASHNTVIPFYTYSQLLCCGWIYFNFIWSSNLNSQGCYCCFTQSFPFSHFHASSHYLQFLILYWILCTIRCQEARLLSSFKEYWVCLFWQNVNILIILHGTCWGLILGFITVAFMVWRCP